MRSSHRAFVAGALVASLGLTACSSMSHQDVTTATGAAVGGVVGSVVTGGSTAGTIGGAVVGGVVGNQLGKKGK